MVLKYKTHYPLPQVLTRIVMTLNGIPNVKAEGEFITEIPRHNLITIEIPDNTSIEEVFNIGTICGAMDFD